MASLDVNPTDMNNVVAVAADATNKRVRFGIFIVANTYNGQSSLLVKDGTTVRARIALNQGETWCPRYVEAWRGCFPVEWFSSGGAVNVSLGESAGDVKVTASYVREK